jgi:RNA polymerase sigma-70 factor (ECF subfamily)
MSLPQLSVPIETLYAHHHGWLKGWLRGKLGNEPDAADLAHDTFIRLLRRANTELLREPRDYLATIARGLVVDLYRRQALERAYLEALAARPKAWSISPEARAIMLESLVAIDRMLDGMGERGRQIFLMVQLEGLGHAEVAAQLGVSVTTVKKYLVRALTHCLLLTAQDGLATGDGHGG